jgi:hydrogenase maturation protease
VGIHAIRALEEAGLPADVPLVDGGTGGFHLLALFHEHDAMILIDATLDGAEPGTVRVLHPRFASDFPRSLSAHDIGLRDLVEAAVLTRPLPHIDLITVSIPRINPMTLELTPAVAAAIPDVVAKVRLLLEEKPAG